MRSKYITNVIPFYLIAAVLPAIFRMPGDINFDIPIGQQEELVAASGVNNVRDLRNEIIVSAAAEAAEQYNLQTAKLQTIYKSRNRQPISISSELFSSNQIRLNTEIYETTSKIYNKEHITAEYGENISPLYKSYVDNINPLIPLAISLCETGSWSDSRYTWTSAIYSRPLSKAGVDLNRTKIEQVTTDTYLVNGLYTYLGCGANCTTSTEGHYHEAGLNDSTSLGPLQILRQYVESEGHIRYSCGESVTDLMSWEDSVIYFTHVQADCYANKDHWNKNHEIKSVYELVALAGAAHNTGNSFQRQKAAGSYWKSSQAIYNYCEFLGSESSINILNKYIDKWYEESMKSQRTGERFSMAGTALSKDFSSITRELGIVKSDYATNWGHKQDYLLKAVLNYMSLERLYYSGEEKTQFYNV